MEQRKESAFRLYLILSGLFIASLVACNLIFQKFFYWTPFTWLGSDYTFEISVGILPYPVTFLITDMISEIFGKKRANQVVLTGLIASVFVFLVAYFADVVPATNWSPVSDEQFSHVFGRTGIAVGASMSAYLLAQFIDVRLYHFWKKLTKGKMLWVRNNFSTITSQLIDTFTVLFLLCSVGAIKWDLFGILFLNGFLFKVMFAAIDTPILYFTTWLVRRKFGLKMGEEIQL